MTLQQLKYVVAIDRYSSFALAAEALDVTQPTLSGMVGKLEDELDVKLFERTSRKVRTTTIGKRIVEQARLILMEANRIKEMVSESKGAVAGEFRISVGPSIAPYILPDFIRIYLSDYPDVTLSVEEMRPEAMIKSILESTADAGIATTGFAIPGLYEIPLYTERFFVYLSESCQRRLAVFRPEELEHEHLWVMKEVQCLRESAFSFCKGRIGKRHVYEAGNIDTLIRIVDANGGYTIIPEMHIPMLTEQQRPNVRRIDGDHLSLRKMSMYIREDFVRERMLNTVVDTLKKFMPEGMMEAPLLRNGIRL
ncbi:LysR substrate-binding domain-containing protein [uncultured Duncaniella sp.]|uniref:LysR family transcriptional regulator n=1 Tax=uncultured Duncaniella sp. TaxID=2768039 RepID=UPI0025EDDF98|nr:LysR substrate-binding domain-containing protein [uncultured Duncaniella sp.]